MNTKAALKKVVRIGKYGNTQHSLFCEINIKDGNLSISGVEGPKRDGDCHGSCGQVVMSEWDITDFAQGWDAEKVAAFREIWSRWHLNDMVAGSPAQMQFLRDNPIKAVYPQSHYWVAIAVLADAGLNPDQGHIHNGKPYKYGSAWLREELPQSVRDFIAALPDTDETPAWT